MSLTDATSLNLGELSNMESALKSNKQLAEAIDEIVKMYYWVDISMVMTYLGNTVDTLKQAYEDIKSFPCSKFTLKTILHYQTMIKNMYVTSSLFVCVCLKALQLHKIALSMAEKGKIDSALKMIEKCADLAKTMADECEKLVKEATELCKLSEEALHVAQNDDHMLREQKERINQVMTDAKMKHAEMEAQTKQLYEQIEINYKKMAEVARKADDARSKEFILSVVSTITAPLQIEILKQKAAESRKEEKEIYAAIAKFGEILKSIGSQEVDFLIKSLAMVKSASERVNYFWKCVEKHCKDLTNVSLIKELNEPDLKDFFIEELKKSGLSWLTLGKINYSAQLSISDVDCNILTSLQIFDNDLLSDLLS